MQQGATLVSGALAGLDEAAFTAPTELPGWTRGHLAAHLSANAEAVGRLVHWAATGEPTPMYLSSDQRAADIEAGSHRSGAELTAWFDESASRLDSGMEALTEEQWQADVVTAQGRTVPASETPWMRAARGDGARGGPRHGHRLRRPARGLPRRPVRRHRRQAHGGGPARP